MNKFTSSFSNTLRGFYSLVKFFSPNRDRHLISFVILEILKTQFELCSYLDNFFALQLSGTCGNETDNLYFDMRHLQVELYERTYWGILCPLNTVHSNHVNKTLFVFFQRTLSQSQPLESRYTRKELKYNLVVRLKNRPYFSAIFWNE